MMSLGRFITRQFPGCLLLLFCCAFCSCTTMDVSSTDDYIGPPLGETSLASRRSRGPLAGPPFGETSPLAGPVQPEPNTVADATRQPPKPPEPNQPAAPAPDANSPLTVTVTQATLLALENNKSLVVQRFYPQISRTFEQENLAVFEPDITAGVSSSRTRSQTVPRAGLGSFPSLSENVSADVGISQLLPTGTALSLAAGTDVLTGSFLQQPFVSTRVGASVTQPLLRGFGMDVLLASVQQAKIDTRASQYELRGFVESLVAQIEETYWDYILADRQIAIVNQSLEIARKQLDETRERIKVGNLAKSEEVAAQAEVALRQENIIDAKSSLAKTKLSLLQLLNPPAANLWNRQLVLESPPVNPTEQVDNVEPHVALALQMRPELNQAKLQWQRDELEIVKTKNGLLPQLNAFVTLGKTGYADSFGKSVQNIRDQHNYDAVAGIIFEYPPLNQGARARNLRAVITRDQAREAINNLAQLVEVDVRSAYLEIVRAQEQVAATAASRKLQEEKLQVETEKFKVGLSTSLLVAQAERDFLAGQISEIQAVVSHIKAFVEFYRLEGTLLERRGIASPGREPVRLPDLPDL